MTSTLRTSAPYTLHAYAVRAGGEFVIPLGVLGLLDTGRHEIATGGSNSSPQVSLVTLLARAVGVVGEDLRSM